MIDRNSHHCWGLFVNKMRGKINKIKMLQNICRISNHGDLFLVKTWMLWGCFQSQAKMMNVRGHHGLVRAAMIRISTINGIHKPLAAGTWVNHLRQLSVQVGGESEHVQTLSEISLHIGHLYFWTLAATAWVNHLGQHGACGGRWILNVYKHTMEESCSKWELGDFELI